MESLLWRSGKELLQVGEKVVIYTLKKEEILRHKYGEEEMI